MSSVVSEVERLVLSTAYDCHTGLTTHGSV